MKQRYKKNDLSNNQEGPSDLTIKRILAFSKALDISKKNNSKRNKNANINNKV